MLIEAESQNAEVAGSFFKWPSIKFEASCCLIKTQRRSSSQKKNFHYEFSGHFFLILWPFFVLYFSFLRKKGRKLKELFSTLGAFRRSRGFCLGTKRGLGGFVRVLFVEVELSKSGCFPSLWWKQSVVFGKLLALCTSSVSVVEDFFSQGFFRRSSWPEWIALQCVHALSLQALQVAHIE